MAFVIARILPVNFQSRELMMRTMVDIDGAVLALASGAAAVLSLTASWMNSLVGVMVAVALLPPTATLGLMLGSGHYMEAGGAAMLLAVNIVCVNLSAKLSFLAKGIKPRTWIEKEKARQSMTIYILVWFIALAILLGVMWIRGPIELP
jgi:uncharacterized membrane protein